MPFVYMLRCRDGSLYTGAAKDLPARLARHQEGLASRYTRSRLPVALVWSRRVRTWPRALRLEWQIKALSRAEKEALIAGFDGTGIAPT
jgi:putative endonuclease